MAAEQPLEILAQVVDIVLGQPIDRFGTDAPGKARAMRLHQFRRGDIDLGGVEILQEGIAEDLDDIGLRQQAQRYRMARDRGRRAQGEAGDKAGRLLPAFGVDVAHEIQRRTIEHRGDGFLPAPRQRRDQIGLARLRRTEHRDAHRAFRGGFQFPRAAGEFAEIPRDGRRFLAHLGTVVGKPADRLGGSLGRATRGGGKGGVGGVVEPHAIPTTPVSRQ